MKARTMFVPLVLAFAVWLAFALRSESAADPPPATTADTTADPAPPQVVEVDRTLQGKNVTQWHAVAARYLNRARTLQRRVHYVIHANVLPGHWLERAFACVHDGEGAWNAHTGNGYYGGLQMDLTFQRRYGDWALRAFGTADRWPASVQIATAIRAYASGRGFYPWPNTARVCGLIK